MTDQEWLYIKDAYHINMNFEQWQHVRKFEEREKKWRLAHIQSGLRLSRKEWEEDQSAKIEAFFQMKKEKKRKFNHMLWRVFGMFAFIAYCLLLVYINEA